MEKKLDRVYRFAGNEGFTVDPIPGIPLIEISGDHRVLVEGHRGVLEYTREKILVNTRLGTLCICGDGLELCKMTRDQLVIHGRIHGLTICRRS